MSNNRVAKNRKRTARRKMHRATSFHNIIISPEASAAYAGGATPREILRSFGMEPSESQVALFADILEAGRELVGVLPTGVTPITDTQL